MPGHLKTKPFPCSFHFGMKLWWKQIKKEIIYNLWWKNCTFYSFSQASVFCERTVFPLPICWSPDSHPIPPTCFTLLSTFVNVNTYRQHNMTSASLFVAYNLWPWLIDGASTLDSRKLDTIGATILGLLRWARWSPGTITTVCWNQTKNIKLLQYD